MTRFRVVLLVGACAVLSGCTSPEATRSRGGGPGADVGNRSKDVNMHEGSQPYWKTPQRIEGNHPPLDSSRQAQELSRPSRKENK